MKIYSTFLHIIVCKSFHLGFDLSHGVPSKFFLTKSNGVVPTIRILEPMTATILLSTERRPHMVSREGFLEKTGQNIVTRKDGSTKKLPGNDEVFLSANDCITIKTPGGGGFGNQ